MATVRPVTRGASRFPGDGVLGGLGHRRVGLSYELQQANVQIRVAIRDQVDHDDADAFLEQGGTFGDEGASMFGTILVGGADQLDGGDEAAAGSGVVDADLIFIRPEQIGLDRQSWLRRGPGLGGDAPTDAMLGRGRNAGFPECGDIDLDRCSEVDLRLGDIPLWQGSIQADDDHGRPLTVKAVPGPAVGERGMEVVAEGHGGVLLNIPLTPKTAWIRLRETVLVGTCGVASGRRGKGGIRDRRTEGSVSAAIELKASLDIPECSMSGGVVGIEADGFAEAFSGFGETLASTEDEAEVEESLVDAALAAADGLAMDFLGLDEAALLRQKAAEVDVAVCVVGGGLDGAAEPFDGLIGVAGLFEKFPHVRQGDSPFGRGAQLDGLGESLLGFLVAGETCQELADEQPGGAVVGVAEEETSAVAEREGGIWAEGEAAETAEAGISGLFGHGDTPEP